MSDLELLLKMSGGTKAHCRSLGRARDDKAEGRDLLLQSLWVRGVWPESSSRQTAPSLPGTACTVERAQTLTNRRSSWQTNRPPRTDVPGGRFTALPYWGGLVVLGRVVRGVVVLGRVAEGAGPLAAGCAGTPDFALYASTTALVISVAGVAHNTGEFC